MSALTLLYAAVVGLLLTGAAAGMEAALRHRRRPARGVWVAAMVATLTAPLWGPALAGLRDGGASAPSAMQIREVQAGGAQATATAGPSLVQRASAALERVTTVMAQPNPWLTLAWGLAAGLGTLLVLGALIRLRRRLDRWPRTRVGGDPVVLAPDFGPACIGLSRPRVVLPRWALGFGPHDLDLMLRHEQSHGRARDPLLLAGALAAVAISPWNPALWWQLLRLRRAVELDCDRRVLASGASPAAYGGMLVAVLSRVRGGAFPAAALIEPASFLERRLTLMKTRTRIGLARTVGALALAGVLVALACETPAPDPVQPEMETAEQEGGTYKVQEVSGSASRFRTPATCACPAFPREPPCGWTVWRSPIGSWWTGSRTSRASIRPTSPVWKS